jgi:hypothetical protein
MRPQDVTANSELREELSRRQLSAPRVLRAMEDPFRNALMGLKRTQPDCPSPQVVDITANATTLRARHSIEISHISGRTRVATASRRISRPSSADKFALQRRGRRECRALASPMARLQQKTQAAVTTGSAETSRHSPRNGFNGLLRALPRDRLSCPCRPPDSSCPSDLDASTGAPGPRDLAVRIVLFVRMETTLQPDTPTASRAQRP